MSMETMCQKTGTAKYGKGGFRKFLGTLDLGPDFCAPVVFAECTDAVTSEDVLSGCNQAGEESWEAEGGKSMGLLIVQEEEDNAAQDKSARPATSSDKNNRFIPEKPGVHPVEQPHARLHLRTVTSTDDPAGDAWFGADMNFLEHLYDGHAYSEIHFSSFDLSQSSMQLHGPPITPRAVLPHHQKSN
ncbi:hypothetical protein BJ508DRAFT_333975 [Ascobolus immersus RN42]|uniref:Uncharacterized protein n=1 Tax=Ascobolus immersus RN42 TaxID=1160509 RepID=A0A3N4HHS6_ASCIM|nr:hypothetical protein BJ508DRAFT_333975 [Ascobolus immersus RN42]